MLETLVSYLEDNKHQILEVWLTDVDLSPPKNSNVDHGGLPFIYLNSVFNDIIKVLKYGRQAQLTGIHQLNEYLGQTLDCHTNHPQSLACLEILLAGHQAFMSVLSPEWDTAGEFSEEEHEDNLNHIKKALSTVMHLEIQKCASCSQKEGCPFIFDDATLRRLQFINKY